MPEPSLETTLAAEREIMDGYSVCYEEAMITSAPIYTLYRQRFVDWLSGICRREKSLEKQVVLDAGCAMGHTLEMLEMQGFGNLTGLDLSPKLIQRGRARGLARTDWFEGTIENHPFNEDSFDAVVTMLTIHHLYDPARFFDMVDTVLRPGGWFFIFDYDDGSGFTGDGSSKSRRGLGDVLRAIVGRVNRRALAQKPVLEPRFNPSHRMLSKQQLLAAIPQPDRYEVTVLNRGVIVPTFLPVLLGESILDRGIIHAGTAVDRILERKRGLFQWVAGRKIR